jgi:hypothetical protein
MTEDEKNAYAKSLELDSEVEQIRTLAKDFGYEILSILGTSRETSLFKTKLDEAVLWAVEGVRQQAIAVADALALAKAQSND